MDGFEASAGRSGFAARTRDWEIEPLNGHAQSSEPMLKYVYGLRGPPGAETRRKNHVSG